MGKFYVFHKERLFLTTKNILRYRKIYKIIGWEYPHPIKY